MSKESNVEVSSETPYSCCQLTSEQFDYIANEAESMISHIVGKAMQSIEILSLPAKQESALKNRIKSDSYLTLRSSLDSIVRSLYENGEGQTPRALQYPLGDQGV